MLKTPITILSLALVTGVMAAKAYAEKELPLVPKPAKLIVQDTPRVPAEGYRHPPLLRDARAEVYKTVGETELLAFVFEPEGHKASDKRPVALLFYGGGWITYNPGQFHLQAKYLASRGMVTVVVEYRVSNRHLTTPFESVMDGKSSVRWVRANAKRLGVDPERVMAGGGSAGGHVAAAAANVPGLDEKEENTSINCKPDALVLFNPVFDNGPPNGYGYDRVGERYKEISPIHNITKKAPPTIVFLGTQDELIPVATGRKYERLMKEVGSRCDLHLYEGEGHGFFNRGDNYSKTSLQMDAFLRSLGYIKGEATLESTESPEKKPTKRTESR